MLGLMMQAPLLLSSILMHAARFFPDVQIVSRTPDKPDHITTYSGLLRRSSQLANALDSIGIKPADRVATLASNRYRHLKLYFGISARQPRAVDVPSENAGDLEHIDEENAAVDRKLKLPAAADRLR